MRRILTSILCCFWALVFAIMAIHAVRMGSGFTAGDSARILDFDFLISFPSWIQTAFAASYALACVVFIWSAATCSTVTYDAHESGEVVRKGFIFGALVLLGTLILGSWGGESDTMLSVTLQFGVLAACYAAAAAEIHTVQDAHEMVLPRNREIGKWMALDSAHHSVLSRLQINANPRKGARG
jgi:hypothetical protein